MSKYCKTTPLLNAVRIKSILQLYEEYKIIFLKQINRNQLTKNIYDLLLNKYSTILKPARESYFHILKEICNKYEFNIQNINIKSSIDIINSKYQIPNDGLVDSIRYLIGKTGNKNFDNPSLGLLRLLLMVQPTDNYNNEQQLTQSVTF